MKSLKYDYYKTNKSQSLQVFNSGSLIASKKVVKAVSYNSTNDVPNVSVVSSTSDIAFGVTNESISGNYRGDVVKVGIVEGVNTTSANLSDPVYYNASGDLVLTGNESNKIGIVIQVGVSGKVLIDIPTYLTASLTHNSLNSIQGGTSGSYYHSNQPINTTDNVTFNSVTVNTSPSSSGTKITNGSSVPNAGSGVAGNIGDVYLQSNGVQWNKVGSGNTDWRADWVGNLTGEGTGFPVGSDGEIDRTSSTISFNNTTREFTIAPSSTSYSIVIKDREYVKTQSEKVTLTNSTGTYHIYFDASGNLTYTNSFTIDIILKYVYVAIIYYNATVGSAVYFGDERHGCTMDAHTHARLHYRDGAVFVSGGALGTFNIDGDGSNSNQTQFSIGSGYIRDEDILHSLSSKSSTDSIPVLYRSGSEWRSVTNANQKFAYSTRAYYNSNVAGNYSLTEVSNNNFCLYHIVATNDKDNPYFSLMGLNQYASKSAARTGAITEISQFSGLPFVEFVFVATVIFETKDSYSNTGKSRIVSTDTGGSYVDWRFTTTLNPQTANENNHNNLGGLQGGGSGNFYHSNQPINTTDSVTFASVTVNGDLYVSGTTTTINSTTLEVRDKNIELGKVSVPSNTTADGGGITLKGSTDKTLNWLNSTGAWTSSENIDLATGRTYNINGNIVLSSSQVLGKNVPTGTIVGTSDSQNLTNKTINGLTYPTVDGTNGQAIVTDGSGNLTFQTVSGGGGGSAITFTSTTLFAVGSPVYYTASGWNLAIASSDVSCVQYVISTITGSGTYTYTALASGELTLTTGQWDARTGGSGGLIAGSTYYLSSTTAGRISTTPGLILSPVLRAISTTKAFISLSINSIESGMGDTFYRDTTTTVANTTSITLTYPPAGKAYVWLSIDGIVQSGADFTLAGNTLTLGATVPSGTLIDVMYARAVLLSDTNAINKMVAFSETVTGSAKTVFNLPSAPSGVNSCIVFVGGAIQDSSKWNLSGNVLTLLDSVAVGVQVVAYVLNSSGVSNSIDAFVTRATNALSVDATVTISTLFGSQTSALYRFFDATDPRISGTISLKHNGTGVDPDVRVDSNSGSVSIVSGTASKLNVYIASNVVTFQNKTASTINLRVYKET